MRVTREQDFVFDEKALNNYITWSSHRQMATFLQKMGLVGIESDIISRAIDDLIKHTGDGSGHCSAGNIRASWCADEDGTTKVTIEFTTVE